MKNWFDLAHATAMLGMEAHSVIGMRLMTLAMGGPKAQREARRMVSEKVQALAAANVQIATDLMTGRGHQAVEHTIRSYRRVVRANQQRLTRR